ncbi:VCBS repeat-containing protein [Streptomyces sp. NBC_00829]|uniref:FG-GAP repeat domain-containing protein n=1 Tax=Streptomyces sp. NBC_00829 TaxID=2903679 RepID=UPI002F91301C|nr:VCBS repeat-containing protein [Streptomyces sp. NBC_00829]
MTYDKRALEIYAAAKNNTEPQKYPRGYSMYPTGGGLWTNAKKMASGDYNGDGKTDMIVVWTDGEVTLYIGDGKGGFSGEKRITKSDTWKDAKVIAGGDFSGSDSSDLVVVWVDGEVTLYTGDGKGGFAKETQLQKPDDTWRSARTGGCWTRSRTRGPTRTRPGSTSRSCTRGSRWTSVSPRRTGSGPSATGAGPRCWTGGASRRWSSPLWPST